MSEISNNTLFAALVVTIILLFLGTLASVVTSSLMFGFNNWLKVSTREVKHIDNRTRQVEVKLSGLEEEDKKLNKIIYQLYLMMLDASNVELSGEEISKRIRERIKATGIFKNKDV